MAERDYAKDLEKALESPRPRVASVQAGDTQRDRATFSTVSAAISELQKRLQATIIKAQELQTLLCGPLNEATNNPSHPTSDHLSVFERLGLETMTIASEIARLDRMLDRALGALR